VLNTSGLAAVALVALAATGCSRGPDRLSGVAATFSVDGALHLAARLRTGEQEGGGWAHVAFLYARRAADGSISRFAPPVPGKGGNASDDRLPALAEGATGQYLSISTGYELSSWIGNSAGWTPLATAGLPIKARSTAGQRLLALWREQDTLYLLTNSWLYLARGEQIVDAFAVTGACAASRLCYVAPGAAGAPGATGVTAAAVYLGKDAVQGSRLTCDSAQKRCAFTDSGATLGSADVGGTSSPRGRFFFHAKDATGAAVPVFVRAVRAASGANYSVVASSPGANLALVATGAYFLGAAALPAGGYAVAIEDYGEMLSVVLVAADLTSKRVINLGRHPDGFMATSLTVLGSGTSSTDQRVHVLYGAGSSTVRCLTIEPTSGKVERDELVELQR